MKVKQLIEALQKMDPELEVYVSTSDDTAEILTEGYEDFHVAMTKGELAAEVVSCPDDYADYVVEAARLVLEDLPIEDCLILI